MKINKVPKNDYIDNKQFNNLLVEYNKNKDRKVYNKIGKIFIDIATGVLHKHNFRNYDDIRKKEFLSYACYLMTKYMDTYDTSKGNAFAWFSQIVVNSCKMNINDTKKRERIFLPINFIENINKDNDVIIIKSEDIDEKKKKEKIKKCINRLREILDV